MWLGLDSEPVKSFKSLCIFEGENNTHLEVTGKTFMLKDILKSLPIQGS